MPAESSSSKKDDYEELEAYDNKPNLEKNYTVHGESEYSESKDVFESEKELSEIL